MGETYLSDNDLAARYNISRNSVWRWHREITEFPRVYRLTPGCSRWKLSEIEAWEQTRAKESTL